MAEARQATQTRTTLSGYPRTVQLRDGGSISLRLMTAADRDSMLAFARSLPEDDLLFLRIDITDPEVMDEWVRNIEQDRTATILAEAEAGSIVGYGSLHHSEASWTRHLGEIRLNISPAFRSKGLGRVLASTVFDLARGLGLQKLIARMTPDQQGARATFEKLGFQMEALLADFVMDRAGRTRDMLIMSYDVTGLTDSAD